jgi:hypothetical protein
MKAVQDILEQDKVIQPWLYVLYKLLRYACELPFDGSRDVLVSNLSFLQNGPK